jgi:hypothetical protein
MLHGFVKVVQVFVSEEIVVGDVKLSPSVVERVAIPFAREVKPLESTGFSRMRFPATLSHTYFGVPKFVSLKVKIAFPAGSMSD